MFGLLQKEYKVLESQEEGDELDHSLRVPPASAFRAHVLTLINAVVLLASLVCLLVSFRLVSNRQRDVSHGFNILGLELPIASIQVEGDFGNDDNYKSSIYRKPPGPEVDAAWARIANSEMIAISTEDVIAIGKDPTTTVRAPEEWNLGPDAHLGVLDVFHQIHCLNALRRGIYYEHYFAPSMGDKKGDLFYNHMGHCMSILLQNIMCAASLDVITHNSVVLVGGGHTPAKDQHDIREYIPDINPELQSRLLDDGSKSTVKSWLIEASVDGAQGEWPHMTQVMFGKPFGGNFLRWFGIVRNTTSWMAPRQGRNYFKLDVAGILCSFLDPHGTHFIALGISGFQNVMTIFGDDNEGSMMIK
ncbi:hypothetical protein PLIIFM63780_005881 [Purpureocillium lilacinum]|nr:hypothetical protein PLIIFM63780_005881 [Purpureocillium lilacinum]